jgi:hypothetical protein
MWVVLVVFGGMDSGKRCRCGLIFGVFVCCGGVCLSVRVGGDWPRPIPTDVDRVGGFWGVGCRKSLSMRVAFVGFVGEWIRAIVAIRDRFCGFWGISESDLMKYSTEIGRKPLNLIHGTFGSSP